MFRKIVVEIQIPALDRLLEYLKHEDKLEKLDQQVQSSTAELQSAVDNAIPK